MSSLKTRMRRVAAFLWEIIKQFYDNNGFVLAGALSFFTLLSVIPLTFLVLSLMGWFLPESYLPVLIDFFEQFVPVQMKGEVNRTLPFLFEIKLGFTFERLFKGLVSIIFLIWLASLIFDIIERILSVTFHVKRGRPFWKSKLTHMALMLFLGSLFVGLSVATGLAQVLARSLQGNFPELYSMFFQYTGLVKVFPILVNLLFSTSLFFIIYKASTPQKLASSSYIKGALFASFFWVVARYIFGVYIEKVNDFSLFFGALAVIARIALWVFYSSVVFILGAEVAWLIDSRLLDENSSSQSVAKAASGGQS